MNAKMSLDEVIDYWGGVFFTLTTLQKHVGTGIFNAVSSDVEDGFLKATGWEWDEVVEAATAQSSLGSTRG